MGDVLPRQTARPSNAKGWPRRWFMWPGRDNGTRRDKPGLKPSPWVNGRHPESGDWALLAGDDRDLLARARCG